MSFQMTETTFDICIHWQTVYLIGAELATVKPILFRIIAHKQKLLS